MGIRRSQLKVFDKPRSVQKSMKEAVKLHEKNIKDQTKSKDTWVSKLKRSVKELIGGKKTYLPKKEFKTTRTKAVKKGLKQAGLSQKEIDRLRGKK